MTPAETLARRIILVRHGQTDWNIDGRLNSRTDIPLNEEGRTGIGRLAIRLQGLNVSSVYCSPMRRARESADLLIAGRHRDLIIDERLRELDFGPFEGHTPTELLAGPQRSQFELWTREDAPVFPNGAETYSAAAIRARSFFETLDPEKSTALVVTHGALLRIMLMVCVLGAKPSHYQRLRTDNAMLSVVLWEEGIPRLVRMNALEV